MLPRGSRTRSRACRPLGNLDTSSVERFQYQLPFEPVDRARLARLKAERAGVRASTPSYEARRRHAQIDARHALGRSPRVSARADWQPAIAIARFFEAVHAAELQLPEAWLPFVVAR